MLRLVQLLAAGILAGVVGAASAQTWPDKPVRLISVFPPGGSVDQVARVLAQQLSKQLGQSVVVENVGGASGSIGTAAVAKAAPDGYTFGVVFDTHGTNPSLIPNLSYDTMAGLEHVTLIGTSPMALVASARSKYMKFADVNADARSVKGVTIGSIGTGSLGHLAMIQAGKQDGWSWTHVPYRGGGPLMNDVVAGHTPLGIGTVFLVMPHVKAGTVRPIAVTGAETPSEPARYADAGRIRHPQFRGARLLGRDCTGEDARGDRRADEFGGSEGADGPDGCRAPRGAGHDDHRPGPSGVQGVYSEGDRALAQGGEGKRHHGRVLGAQAVAATGGPLHRAIGRASETPHRRQQESATRLRWRSVGNSRARSGRGHHRGNRPETGLR